MKPWMGFVAVLVTLVVGVVLMLPSTERSTGGATPATAGRTGAAGSKATDEKIATIARGERVTIEEHLRDGRFTIVEFTADW